MLHVTAVRIVSILFSGDLHLLQVTPISLGYLTLGGFVVVVSNYINFCCYLLNSTHAV